jgi:hypothetical protein
MSARPLPSSSFASQKALVMQGMQASIAARTKAGLDLQSPRCIYGLCEAHNVKYREELDDLLKRARAQRKETKIATERESRRAAPELATHPGAESFGFAATLRRSRVARTRLSFRCVVVRQCTDHHHRNIHVEYRAGIRARRKNDVTLRRNTRCPRRADSSGAGGFVRSRPDTEGAWRPQCAHADVVGARVRVLLHQSRGPFGDAGAARRAKIMRSKAALTTTAVAWQLPLRLFSLFCNRVSG